MELISIHMWKGDWVEYLMETAGVFSTLYNTHMKKWKQPKKKRKNKGKCEHEFVLLW